MTEALRTVEVQFSVVPQSLPRDALIAAPTDAVWVQRGAYARVRETLVACPELVGESMQRCASAPLLFFKRVM